MTNKGVIKGNDSDVIDSWNTLNCREIERIEIDDFQSFGQQNYHSNPVIKMFNVKEAK